MATKIRLARRGRKFRAIYDIVVADSRSPRDGRFIEKLGTFNPNTNPVEIILNEESALKWILTGAQPTDTTRDILSSKGIMFRKHLQVGVNKGAISQEEADKKYAAWKAEKDAKENSRLTDAEKAKVAAVQAAADKRKALKLEADKKAQEAAAAKAAADAAAVVEAISEEAPEEAASSEETAAEA